jgi:multidrug efflux pump subunit AcrA (membrane-fusion protein)
MKWILVRVLPPLLLVLVMSGCASQSKPSTEPTPTAETAAPAGIQSRGQEYGGQIIAQGRVVPVRSAALSLSSAGIVKSVPVTLGEQVAAGQLMAQLDTLQLGLQLAQAEANLAAAQARLDQLDHGPTDQDMAAAQQNVTSAQAAYDKVRAGPAASDAAAARAALTAAQQNYTAVSAGPTSDQLSSLAAQLNNARAALDQAQAAYDRIQGVSDISARPESLQLQQATNNLNVAAAAYKDAQAHPTEAELAAAFSQVQAAQAALDRLTPDEAEIQAKLAALANAQAALARLQPAADDRAILEAGVASAQVAREIAAAQLAAARLLAPFAGTVMTLDIEVGEYATPGMPIMRLADTSAWQIETNDLTELSVAQIKEGMPASVTFDALPGLELSGRVSQIQPYGDTRQGDIVYTVIITPDQQDERLRWNMTAKISIGSR